GAGGARTGCPRSASASRSERNHSAQYTCIGSERWSLAITALGGVGVAKIAQVGEQDGGHRGPVGRRMFGGDRHRPIAVGAHDQTPAVLTVPQHNLFRGAVVLGDFVDSVDMPPGGGEAPTSGEGEFSYRWCSHLRSPFGGVWRPGVRPGP